MITVYSEEHRKRNARTELLGGELVPPFEKPARMDFILDRLASEQLGPVVSPRDFGLNPILAVHDAQYVSFLETCWQEWTASGMRGEAIAASWPARRMQQRCPTDIEGKLGYYALAAETSISSGTWEAARASANVALEAASRLQQEASVFALCRPPGHHAALDMYGGYCFFNNAGIAAQSLLDSDMKRIAILDIDFHHGNGTQDIFYNRDDVLFISIHGQPEDAFPHFLGYSDEIGEDAGEGFNLNFPLPPGTGFSRWRDDLRKSLERIASYAPEALIVSLGTDTFELDPISFFKLTSDDFTTTGQDIAQLKLPTIFVMEGGYAVEEIGINTVNVLQGFENA